MTPMFNYTCDTLALHSARRFDVRDSAWCNTSDSIWNVVDKPIWDLISTKAINVFVNFSWDSIYAPVLGAADTIITDFVYDKVRIYATRQICIL